MTPQPDGDPRWLRRLRRLSAVGPAAIPAYAASIGEYRTAALLAVGVAAPTAVTAYVLVSELRLRRRPKRAAWLRRIETEEDALRTQRRALDLTALMQVTVDRQIDVSVAVWELARRATPRGTVEFRVVDEGSWRGVVITVARVRLSDLDLDSLRQLVEGVDVRAVEGTAVVPLPAPAAPDWFPDPDELKLVLEALDRHDPGGAWPGGDELLLARQ